MPSFSSCSALILLAAVLNCGGCIERVVTVQSNPPGALVYLNEQEIGRTPVSKEFLSYGNYSVVVRKDGYQTLKTQADVSTPWWQFIPLDLFTDMMPIRDEHVLSFNLTAQPPADPAGLVSRGEQMRSTLESGEKTKTRVATTQATTKALAKAATQPVQTSR